MPPRNDATVPNRRRAPLTERQVERMLSIAFRYEQAFTEAKSGLKNTDFAPHQRGYLAVWQVALDFYTEHQSLPQYEDLVGELERKLEETPESFSEAELSLLDDWLELTYSIDAEVFEHASTMSLFRKYLRMFIEDRTTDKLRVQFSDPHNTANLTLLLADLGQESQRISMVSDGDIEPLFAPGWSDQAQIVQLRDTTLPFVNSMLDGGDGVEEVNGLLAPFGTCKTTFAVQMAAGRARKCRQVWLAGDRQVPLGLVYMFIYEGSLKQMRVRALSFAAQIHRTKLKDLTRLNGPGQYDPYERVIFRDMFANDITVPCERQRVRVVEGVLNTNLRIVSLSGMEKENSGRGTGYVEEIARIINRDMSRQRQALNTEVFCEVVIVDYVGAAVERAAMANNWNESEIRRRTERFPYQMVQQVSMPFECPVWVLHQFSGQANGIAPGRVPKGTDAKDTKSFKENLDFLLVVGSKNHQDLCVWSVDKARRFESNMPPEIVFVDGAMCAVHSVSNEYMLDRSAHEIVPVSEMQGMYTARSDDDDDDDYADGLQPAEIQANALRDSVHSPASSAVNRGRR